MVKLSLKILILTIIVLAVNYLIYSSLSSYYWGDPAIRSKAEYLHKNQLSYNALFLGSSRIFAQADPALFDSITAEFGIHSFNFGVNALTPPLSYYILDNIIERSDGSLKYIIIEMNDLDRRQELHVLRAKYWYTPALYCFALSAIIQSGYSFGMKYDAIKNHTLSYFEKLLNIGLLKRLIDYHSVNYDPSPLGPWKNGFYPLDSLIATSPDYTERKNLEGIRNAFIEDSSKLTENKKISEEAFSKPMDSCFNGAHLDKINELIRKAESKGIKLIFLLPPRIVKYKYEEILPVFYRINPANRLELSDSRKYPEFYEPSNSFDLYHLTQKGSELFTAELAREFLKLENR